LTQSPIDADVIARLKSDLGEEIAGRLLASFAQEIRSKTNAVLAAIGESDGLAARDQAHALRSVSLEYGAVELADVAGAIEKGQAVEAARLQDCCERTLVALATVH